MISGATSTANVNQAQIKSPLANKKRKSRAKLSPGDLNIPTRSMARKKKGIK